MAHIPRPFHPFAPPSQLVHATYKDIFFSFVLMGWTAFGGPAAHIGIFQKAFVEVRARRASRPPSHPYNLSPSRASPSTVPPFAPSPRSPPSPTLSSSQGKRWMSTTVFNELLSLGQCMPGPTSTQVSFAIGVTQQGIPGGLLSGMLFQYPGLMMMSLAGAGAAEVLVNPDDWLRGISAGLSAAGVALVVSAAVGLAKGQCKDQVTSALCLMSAVVAYYYTSNWIFPLLIVIGGLTTLYTKRNQDVTLPDETEKIHHLGANKMGGAFLIAAWIGIWIAVAAVVNTTDYDGNEAVYWFEAFYRTGSIIFGGGQVVLPLLLKDVVQYDSTCQLANGTLAVGASATDCVSYVDVIRADSWITEEQFFAGLAIVQAMPGPLFNLSAYIGALAARRAGVNVAAGIASAWFGLFGPGVLLIYGVLPFWGAFRKQPLYRRALPGLNSSAVGLVVAAVFQMSFKVREISPMPDVSVVIGILAFYGVHFGFPKPDGKGPYKVPAPLAIVAGGFLGLIAWAAGCT